MRKLIYFIPILLLGFSSTTVLAQEGDLILNRFDALAVGRQVQLTCVISSGSTCAGINIYRSGDNFDFQLVGNIAGICGSTSAPVQYNYVDEYPLLNQTSYYKLELGGVGFTEVISITNRDVEADEVRIQPNPAFFQSTIYFSNPSFAIHILNLLDYNGRSIIERTTTEDFFVINVSQLPNGIYPILISVEKTNEQKTGKLVVKK